MRNPDFGDFREDVEADEGGFDSAAFIESERLQDEETRGFLASLAERFRGRLARSLVFGLAFSTLSANRLSTEMAHAAVRPQAVEQAQEEKSEEEWVREQISLLRQEIAEYKALGYDIEPDRRVTLGDADKVLVEPDGNEHSYRMLKYEMPLSMALSLVSRSKFSDAKDPVADLKKSFQVEKEIPPELSRSGGKIKIAPLGIKIIKQDLEDKMILVRLYNFLKPQNPLVSEVVGTYGDQDTLKITAADAAHLKEIIAEEFSNLEEERRTLEAILPAQSRRPWTYELMKDKVLSETEISRLEKFFKGIDGGRISITSVPEGGEYDAPSQYLEITRETFARNGFRPIKVNGHIKWILLRQDIPVKNFDLTQGTINGEPVIEMTRDKYGSLVRKTISTYGIEKKTMTSKTVNIEPQLLFARDLDAEENAAPVMLGGESLGLPDLGGVFYQRTESPLAFTGDGEEYGVYSNMDHKQVKTDFGRHFAAIAEGISFSEKAFGLRPGEAVSNIYIVNASYSNAFAKSEEASTAYFHDELLRAKGSPKLTASHEAWHLLYHHFGIENKELYNHFRVISELERFKWEFFSKLDEKDFYAEQEEGGHSKDNPNEFFASFMNSLYHPKWQERIMEKDDRFKRVYRDTLDLLRLRFSELQIKKDAPVFGKLSEAIEFLHKSIN